MYLSKDELTLSLQEEGNLTQRQTEESMPCEHRGRGWSDTPTSQGTGIASNPPKAWTRQGSILS